MCNYYRRFIAHYSTIALPLTELTHKDTPFEWTPKAEESFQNLKTRMSEAPILNIPSQDLQHPFNLTTDASDFAIRAVLAQDQGAGFLPVAYTSRKLQPAERNYSAYDKEMLAILHGVTKWRVYLEGRHFKIYTDHATLHYLPTQPTLNGRQARWSETLQGYDYEILHISGKKNVVADAISRRPDLQTNNLSAWETERLTVEAQQADPEFREIILTRKNSIAGENIPWSFLDHFSIGKDNLL